EKFLGTAQTTQDTRTAEQNQARETEFEGLIDTAYGSKKQIVLDRTKQLMTDSVAEGMKDKVAEVLKDIPNDMLFVLTAVLDGVHNKYIAEDKIIDGDSIGGDVVGWQTEAENTMKSDAYKDFRNAGHDAARQRVQELFQKIAAAKK
ncbi:unnamed protein product, partial [marine sediment metagenome]